MTRTYLAIFVVAVVAVVIPSIAGVSMPDVVLYGQVFIAHQMQHAPDDVWVVARVGGVPVGSYHLGDRAPLGDSYALRIRMESLADGGSPGSNTAHLGDTADIYVKKGVGEEQLVASFALAPAKGYGHVEYLDLGERIKGDWNGDAQVTMSDYPDFATCMQGPNVETRGQCPAVYDFDFDTDIDLADFRNFEQALAAGKSKSS